jgi:hypothetical protein
VAEADFIAGFHNAVDRLDRSARHDNQTMWLLGSLAARLVQEASADNWTDLKLRIGPTALTELVTTLTAQADAHAAADDARAAYVAHLLASSLVAGRIADARLRQRDQMLNTFIDTAATVFRQSHSAA